MTKMRNSNTVSSSQKHASFISIVLLVGCIVFCIYYFQPPRECAFFRNNTCLTCNSSDIIPTGYKENCDQCPNRTATYIEGGIVPAWACAPNNIETTSEMHIERDLTPCPKSRPIKDVVGNCYTCDTPGPIQLFVTNNKNLPCLGQRYTIPDNLTVTSLKCPSLDEINDPEVCVICQGVWQHDSCNQTGQNFFCHDTEDCPEGQWCFPFKTLVAQKGICTDISKTNWLCSQTGGYDLERTQKFCARQKAHIPTLDEIEQANEDLTILCPTLDMWTFFAPDGAVWLESFALEFIFTREGESQKLGGRQFYALCHKD